MDAYSCRQDIELSGWTRGATFFLTRLETERLIGGRMRFRLKEDLLPGPFVSICDLDQGSRGKSYVCRVDEISEPGVDGLCDVWTSFIRSR